MGMARSFAVVAAVSLMCGVVSGEEAKSTSLVIQEQDGSYVVTVPVSRLSLRIPKGGLAPVGNPRQGGTASSRYFYLQDKSTSLIVSGWFESDQGANDLRQFWAREAAAQKKQGLPEPEDVSFEKIGGWDAIVYDQVVAGVAVSNIRAELRQAGTWIDLHLSLTGSGPREVRRARLAEALTAIEVAEKPTK